MVSRNAVVIGVLLAWGLVDRNSLARFLLPMVGVTVAQFAYLMYSVHESNKLKSGRAGLPMIDEVDAVARPKRDGWRPKLLVCGGSGRLGLASARHFVRRIQKEGAEGVDVILSGRNPGRGQKAVDELLAYAAKLDMAKAVTATFVSLDITDQDALRSAMQGCTMVMHCAGPFVGDSPDVLPVAIECGAQYVDICDDNHYATLMKDMSERAKENGVCALITTGIQPGFSSMMGSEVVAKLGTKASKVEFSYNVMGTGGSGPGILASTFMLIAEPVYIYVNGQAVEKAAAFSEKWVEFGAGVGKRMCYLLPVPEIRSCHKCLGVPNVEVRFGTAPECFNRANQLMALMPKFLLLNRDLMYKYAEMLTPLCGFVDQYVGATCSMHVQAFAEDGSRTCTMMYAHDDMVECIGISVATFAWQMLQRKMEGELPSGVFYPEELLKDEAHRQEFFEKAKHGAFQYSVTTTKNLD
jgi:saccharopine dehydrogenase-like NADP-dependent oxidoreductase